MKTSILRLLIPVLLFSLGVVHYLPFLSDDALISLRYSNRLADGQGLTWNDGERVEGYSNLLWTLTAAGLMKAGFDGIAALRIMGIAFSLAFLALLFTHYRGKPFRAFLPILYASLSAPLAIWAVGGLEQPLVLLLVAVSVPLVWRAHREKTASSWFRASVPLALLTLTRPDGILFTVFALMAVLFCGGGRKAFLLTLLPLAAVLGQTAFRLAYYHDFLPNTARIKMNPSPELALMGIKYLLKGAAVLLPLVAVSLAGLPGAIRSRDSGVILPMTMAAGWSLYIVIIGGDIFPGFRHFLPLLALFTWASAESLMRRSGNLDGKIAGVGLALLPLYALLQFHNGSSRSAASEKWEWDGMVTALALRDAYRVEQPLIAVTAAGSLPYWSGFPSLDMLGLNDRYLARNHRLGNGSCMCWHDICDPAYILSREPDIVSFNAAGDTTGLPVARALIEDTAFTGNYSRVVLTAYQPYTRTGLLWFSRRSEITGFSREGDSIFVPAVHFNGFKHTYAEVRDGVPGITVMPGKPAAAVLRGSEITGSVTEAYSDGCSCAVESLGNGGFLVELRSEDTVFVTGAVLSVSR